MRNPQSLVTVHESYDRSFDTYNSSRYESGPLDEFLTEDIFPPGVDGPMLHVAQDISIILNQKRITQDLVPAINQILSQVRTSDVSDQFAGLSDDDLVSCIKSRYVQNPSELIDWSQYLMSKLDELNVPVEPETPTESESSVETPETE